MELRLPDAAQKYDFENEQQFRRSVEAFARKPLTLYSDGTGTEGRFDATNIVIFNNNTGTGIIQAGSWSGGLLTLGPTDSNLEGGQIDIQGGLGLGTPYRTWSLDNWTGVLRLFETGNIRHQFSTISAQLYNAAIGDASFGEPWAVFAHNSRFNSTDYALVTKSDGLDTRLNAAVSGSLYLCIGNVQKFQINTASIRPVTDSALDLGGNNPNRFRDAYLGSAGRLFIADLQILGTRKTGWTAATNTKTRTTFDTTTVTLPILAAHVGALIDDLISHGVIGA